MPSIAARAGSRAVALDFHLAPGCHMTFVLSLGSPALAMEVLGSLPSVGRARVVQESLGSLQLQGCKPPTLKDSSEGL